MTVLIQKDLEANSAMDFFRNRIVLRISPQIILHTACAGKFCDRKYVNDWNGEGGHKTPVGVAITLTVGMLLFYSTTLMF